jgi:hypothetical protein
MLNRTQQTDFDFVFISILMSIWMGFCLIFVFFARSLRSKAISSFQKKAREEGKVLEEGTSRAVVWEPRGAG